MAAIRLEEAGAATVMPLASPIGSGQGMQDWKSIERIVHAVSVPVVVDAGIADNLLPRLAEVLGDDCELRPDEQAAAILGGDRKIASEEDWATEYNDRILAIRVVPDMDKAMAHIREYGTMHSEAILTEDMPEAERFLNQVDAAVVYLNASTRFTDGAVFGFGGELGISTQKLHARGPMGLEALVSYKYKVYGNGQVR